MKWLKGLIGNEQCHFERYNWYSSHNMYCCVANYLVSIKVRISFIDWVYIKRDTYCFGLETKQIFVVYVSYLMEHECVGYLTTIFLISIVCSSGRFDKLSQCGTSGM